MEDVRRIRAEINLDNIVYNLEVLCDRLPKNVKKCAVLKADAYGHGVEKVSKKLTDKVDYFAVATPDEALELRDLGIKNEILILGYTWPESFPYMIRNGISIALFSLKDAEVLSKLAVIMNCKAKVHIAVDTGLHRNGFLCTDEGIEAVRKIRKMKGISVEGIFTHFAKADEADKSYSVKQLEDFKEFIKKVEQDSDPIPIHHCANSAAVLDFPESSMDMVRIGLSIYGYYPSKEVSHIPVLKPAMEIKSHITLIKKVAKGEGISYNPTKVLAEDKLVATIPVGYGDGYARSLSNIGYVLIHDRKAEILGSVCMDHMMVDVSDIPDVSVGDEVTLIGSGGDKYIGFDDVAPMSGRIINEWMTDINPRVPRVYLGDI